MQVQVLKKKIEGPQVYPDNMKIEALTLGKYYVLRHCHYASICG